ncbi:GntR family transcriptional regulator [Halomonas sp. GD1P12]|uniref:GntR family transcriptional regulator n=1 Tax=Halomonas sp. GD1P12 TaxID=2982691 RepID=UPI0021E3B691|nr:GntR family transcriptional regulator [Halomonas sp. GD1P12]UYG00572.1 GntR family transcriptional regulator [Halomonas sp. GD1P12]
MTKILQRHLYREVADRIGDLIEHGELAPGERISERELCEQFGVSRTPLREALKVLAAEGLIQILPNRGARVVRLTFKSVKDTYDLMAALEGLAGELACRHIDDSEIKHIRTLHDAMLGYYHARDLNNYFDMNRQIHERILAASDNPVLQETYNNLSQRVKRVRYSKKMTEQFWRRAVDDHEQMITALENRDSQKLGEVLREHLCNKIEVATLAGVIGDDGQNAASA